MKTDELKKAAPVSLPRRDRAASKRDFGRVLIVAGSVGYTGAPALATRAAVRGGAGLVSLGVPEAIYPIAAVKCDEAMPFPLPCGEDGLLTPEALDPLRSRLERADCLALGPGLGRSEGVRELVLALLREAALPVVLDADGLWAASADPDALREAPGRLVLTPHEGEFARLGGDLSAGREAAALGFAGRYGCTLVLKGMNTVAAFPDGDCYINSTGNPGMARGGSGDVLTGLMAALLCQLPFRDAVRAAVYLHGLSGDMCAVELGEYGMTPGDIIEKLPSAMKTITEV